MYLKVSTYSVWHSHISVCGITIWTWSIYQYSFPFIKYLKGFALFPGIFFQRPFKKTKGVAIAICASFVRFSNIWNDLWNPLAPNLIGWWFRRRRKFSTFVYNFLFTWSPKNTPGHKFCNFTKCQDKKWCCCCLGGLSH